MGAVIDVIVSCSNRKRYPVRRNLSLRSLEDGTIAQRAVRWLSRLKNTDVSGYPAESLYAGDHWSIVRSLASSKLKTRTQARVWVCSAGYGLIPYHALIKPYDATFARGHRDSVSLAHSLTQARSENQRWWDSLASRWKGPTPGEPRKLSDIPTVYGRTPMLVVLSSDYLAAVATDLQILLSDAYYRDHLSIISSGSDNLSTPTSQSLLPCNATMQHAVGGVRVSLNIRIAAYLLRQLGGRTATYDNMRKICGGIKTRTLPQTGRKTLSDDAVRDFIKHEISKDPKASRSRLLARLREQNYACEQSRFARLYRSLPRRHQRNAHA
jgi:hypothetical protein